MAVIRAFDKGSPAKRAGLKKGDDVQCVNGRPFSDILDYLFFDSAEALVFSVLRRGREKSFSINKFADEPLGVSFEDDLELKPARCLNKCVFCFVDQLPEGMRETLYVKDDDYRLSVICGNYVTLTNLKESDFERIIEMRLSPLYISVHAVDGEVRKNMVRNPKTLSLMDDIKRLTDAGIVLHTQVVLCEGLNDGAVLKDTLEKLYAFYPSVASLAVVPVGLTGCREGLYPLKPLSAKCLNETLDIAESFNEGKNWCWCSDEFYIKANRPLPEYAYYGDFPQIENGVGLVADFEHNLAEGLEKLGEVDGKGRRVALITGESFYGTLTKSAEKIKNRIKNCEIDVVKIKNMFFGGAVSVSGLVVGRDILSQAPKGYDKYIIPHNMLREFSEVFLDGTTLDEVKKQLGRVEITRENGGDLADIISR